MNGTIQTRARRLFPLALLTFSVALGSYEFANGQQRPNLIEAKPLVNVEDNADITKPDSKVWVLDFACYAPRFITVDIPGRGRRICWYLRYEVVNRTKEPRRFIPRFDLVPTNLPGKSYMDTELPIVLDAVKRVEDPLGHLDLQSSDTIMAKPIPVTRPGGPPRPVSGVAIWDDVPPEVTRFSIFVRGLSNGYSLAEVPPDNKQIVKCKTLQMNFMRVSDKFTHDAGDIKFVPPPEWVYRDTGVTLTGAGFLSSRPVRKDKK